MATWLATFLRRVGATVAGAIRRAGSRVWGRIGPPLRGWVPLVLALTGTAALAPLATAAAVLLLLRFCEGRPPESVRRPSPKRWGTGVRWALVASLLSLYALRGTSWWPVP